ncbi:MAG: DUF1730 domain-containing protein [Candidatus Marinimicrobia bacterium]|nr:DUF1730 domain-containing protein [Candidatus Neomarinimicrobiota bacterium]
MSPASSSDLRAALRARAAELGFAWAGFASAAPVPRAAAFMDWLGAGHHAGMGWLARAPARRTDPGRVLPGLGGVVVLGWALAYDEPDPAVWQDPLRGRIARFAWGPDYHDIIGAPLAVFAADLARWSGGQCRAYVDTGPLLEHELAWTAGLGFLGRNALLIHPDGGSWLHLAVILTTARLPPDVPTEAAGAVWRGVRANGRAVTASCGACRRCLAACPTGALAKPYQVDARSCLSYWTIESRTVIPAECLGAANRWVFGCDDCQSICPWNRRLDRADVRPAAVQRVPFEPARCAPRLADLLRMNETQFKEIFAASGLLRTGLARLRRNAVAALATPSVPGAPDLIAEALRHPDPLTRAQAQVVRLKRRSEEEAQTPVQA